LLDTEVRKAKAERRRCWRRIERGDRGEEACTAYKEARREQGRTIYKAKERIFQEFAEQVDRMEDGEVSKTISAMIKRRTRGGNQLLGSDQASLEEYARHFEQQFAMQDFHRQGRGGTEAQANAESDPEEEVPFGIWEVELALKRLPRAKAPGASGLRNELLKETAGEMSELVWLLFRMCWDTGRVPKEWSVAIIHPVPKKGNMSLISNYRPISLTESLRKLYEKCLMDTLSAKLDGKLDAAQGGFRRKRSTIDQIACLQEAIVQRKKTLGRAPVTAYLDIKAAYDTVYRPLLWESLKEGGVRGNLLRAVMALFEGNTSRVAVQGHQSRAIQQEVGLMQGSILSPILYAMHINELPARLEKISSIPLGGKQISGLMYADDIALVADNAINMERLLAECQSFSEERCFRFQPMKCEILAEGGIDTERCKLYGNTLKRSTSFQYLGMFMNAQGIDAVGHIANRSNKTMESINMMRSVGFNGGGFAGKVKRRIYLSFIRPKLEYGLQIIEARGKKLELLERTQASALRAMFGVGKSTGKERMRTFAKIETMELRSQALNAGWTVQKNGLGERFMIMAAKAAHAQRGLRSSVFSIEKRNPLMTEYRDATVWSGKGKQSEGHKIIEQIYQDRKTREQSGITVEQLDRSVKSRHMRRMLTVWILRRFFGKPGTCVKCMAATVKLEHVQQCTGLDVDEAIRRNQWGEAYRMLLVISKECLGRSVDRLARYIALEREYSEERACVRESHPTHSTPTSGTLRPHQREQFHPQGDSG
jgi:hypothetical protein